MAQSGNGCRRGPCLLERKVYVGGLGTTGTRGELEHAFGCYGSVINVWIARNPPGYAVVEFADPRDAEDAVLEMDGQRLCGRYVRVEMSKVRAEANLGDRSELENERYLRGEGACGSYGQDDRGARHQSGRVRDDSSRSSGSRQNHMPASASCPAFPVSQSECPPNRGKISGRQIREATLHSKSLALVDPSVVAARKPPKIHLYAGSTSFRSGHIQLKEEDFPVPPAHWLIGGSAADSFASSPSETHSDETSGDENMHGFVDGKHSGGWF